ncbi:MAG: hypothetical protein ACPGEG_00120 [Salibacteraceae bacterium]
MKLEISIFLKRLTLLSLIIISGVNLWAQDETMRIFKNDVSEYRNDTLWTVANQPTLILIPFEPLMYKSQIDRSIGMNDGTNYQQIVGNWRRGLDNMLFIETDVNYSVIRLLAEDEERKKDLYSMYSASSLDYRELPKKEENKKKINLSRLKSKEKEEPETQKGTRMENGQIVSDPNSNDRFMARSVNDSAIFDYMYGKYGSVLYVFINQFEIGPMSGLDYRAFESDEYQRQITVHYSVFANKYEIHSGVATSYFSSTNNSQKDIILQSFSELSKQITNKIPTLLQAKSLNNSTE